MWIFLTGGSGFIGKNFLKFALKNGHYIFATTRKKQIFKHKRLKWLIGDFSLKWKELNRSDILIHLAAAGVASDKKNKKKIFNTNIIKSLRLLENANNSGCKNWLVASSSSEYGSSLKKYKSASIRTVRKPDDYYSLSKAIFTDESIKLALKHKCKLRIMRIFPVYGDGESKGRLYSSLKEAAIKEKNFKINNPYEIRDFSTVEYVSKILLNSSNFKKNKFKFYQIKHISQNNVMSVKEFATKLWNKFKTKKKLKFNINYKKIKRHISSPSSRWK